MVLNEYIREKESKQQLGKIQFRGLPAWLVIRKHLYPKLTQGIYRAEVPIRSSIWTLFKSMLYGILEWFKHYDYWFLSSTITRRELEGKWVDIFCDPVAEMTGSAWFLEYTVTSHFPKNKLRSRHISSLVPVIILEKIARRILLRYYEIKKISSALSTHFSETELVGLDLAHVLFKFYFQYRFMHLLLRIKKNPKAVFVVPSYSYYGYIRAFREKGIPITEIQHGVISREHYAYYLYERFHENYFPNHILTMGSIPHRSGIYWEYTQVHPVGSFILEYHLEHKVEIPEIMAVRNKYQYIICVSLQDCETGMQLIPQLEANRIENCLFVLKPRRTPPDFYRTHYNFPKNVWIDDRQSVYELILNTDFHLTAYSSTALEAPALGKINLLVNINNKARNYYGEILAEGVTTHYLDSLEQLILWLSMHQYKTEEEIRQAHRAVVQPGYDHLLAEFLGKY